MTHNFSKKEFSQKKSVILSVVPNFDEKKNQVSNDHRIKNITILLFYRGSSEFLVSRDNLRYHLRVSTKIEHRERGRILLIFTTVLCLFCLRFCYDATYVVEESGGTIVYEKIYARLFRIKNVFCIVAIFLDRKCDF